MQHTRERECVKLEYDGKELHYQTNKHILIDLFIGDILVYAIRYQTRHKYIYWEI